MEREYEETVELEEIQEPTDKRRTGDGLRTESSTHKMVDVSNDPVLNADVFKNRREMAWASLYMLIGLTGVLFVFLFLVLGLFYFSPQTMIALTGEYKTYLEWSSTFIGWAFSAFATIILTYMGVAAYYYNGYMKNIKK